ncbi:hypothetical protein FJY93_00180 [Candidatus Kaiserbacteria bacterium]|nr:hypothetical protein [Candidatus Kaiserbacteria bacterium]
MSLFSIKYATIYYDDVDDRSVKSDKDRNVIVEAPDIMFAQKIGKCINGIEICAREYIEVIEVRPCENGVADMAEVRYLINKWGASPTNYPQAYESLKSKITSIDPLLVPILL